ncbi:MAG: Mur ligase family protein [Mariprofundus sp.]|nr:Mur ligase family protein [Mariprofundus sp.]
MIKNTASSDTLTAFIRSLDNPLLDMDYRPGLERVRNVLGHFPSRRPKLRIRIAGTNGKGSTGHFLESAFRAAGFTTGFYTSPHILHFNERIRIHGSPASDETLASLLTDILERGEEYAASPFELATVLALNTFAQAQVDIEILECGLGARLDATTAVPADMALITPIGLDHQAWLGDTIQKIATEKAFVMQGCAFSVSVPQQPEVSAVLQSFNPDLLTCNIDTFEALKAPGRHQHINASLACAAINMLKEAQFMAVDPKKARKGIISCQLPGRLQKINIGRANVWLDAAHNQHAVEALLPSLRSLADPFDAILVFTRQDRSLKDALSMLRPYTKRLITNSDAKQNDNTELPAAALQEEIRKTPTGNFLVLGSFTTVAAILRSLQTTGSRQ